MFGWDLVRMVKRSRNSFDLAAGLGLASMHAGTTMFYRWPMLAAACAEPGKPNAEMSRMVNEKTAAFIQGAFAAQREAMRLTGAAMTGQLDVTDLTHAAASITDAGLRPAFRTVKANSRRLSRKS